MRYRAMGVTVLALVVLATLVPAGCRHNPEPSPGGETTPSGAQTPPPSNPGSPVAWVVRVPATGSSSPGVFDLATPATLTIDFSGPVDQTSVAAALARNFTQASPDFGTLGVVWKDTGLSATLEVGDMPSRNDLWVEVSPSGGLDVGGKTLMATADTSFVFRPGRPLALWRYLPTRPGGPPEAVAAFDQPYTIASLAPTGDRMLLCLPTVTYGGDPGPSYPSHYYLLNLGNAGPAPAIPGQTDTTKSNVAQPGLGDGDLIDLGPEDTCPYRWLPDGTLCYGSLLFSPSPGGLGPAWLYSAPAVSGPGGQEVRWVEGLRQGVIALQEVAEGGADRLVFSSDGSKLALVLEDRASVLDLASGNVATIDHINARTCPAGDDGPDFFCASISRDGRYLLYSDWVDAVPGHRLVDVWLADLETGKKHRIAERITGAFGWSPTGQTLLLHNMGVVDPTGQPLIVCSGEGLWSPSGDMVWIAERGLVRASDWTVALSLPEVLPGWSPEDYAWSPDGTKFAGYFSGRNLVISPSGGVLWEGAADEAGVHRGKGEPLAPLWSPDGRYLAFGTTVLSFAAGSDPAGPGGPADPAAPADPAGSAGPTGPAPTTLDLKALGPQPKVIGWSGGALLIATGGRLWPTVGSNKVGAYGDEPLATLYARTNVRLYMEPKVDPEWNPYSGELHTGQEVAVTLTQGTWNKVWTPDFEGWLPAWYLLDSPEGVIPAIEPYYMYVVKSEDLLLTPEAEGEAVWSVGVGEIRTVEAVWEDWAFIGPGGWVPLSTLGLTCDTPADGILPGGTLVYRVAPNTTPTESSTGEPLDGEMRVSLGEQVGPWTHVFAGGGWEDGWVKTTDITFPEMGPGH